MKQRILFLLTLLCAAMTTVRIASAATISVINNQVVGSANFQLK